MSNDELLTDDYVAGILAKEAADHSLKYSSTGMEAFRSTKKPANIPKPNTRFLSRIIRSTESHNASLLAAEAAESQARLRQLEKAEERQKRCSGSPSDIRRRQMGDIKAILGGTASSRSRGSKNSGSSSKREDKERARGRRSASPARERGHDQNRRRERSSESHRARRTSRKDIGDERGSRSAHRGDEKRRHRPRSRDREEETKRSIKERHHRSRRDGSAEGEQRKDNPRSTASRRDRNNGLRSSQIERESDSDPLDDIIGPVPPPEVRLRGRGAQSARSGIDKRFEADYDPRTDVEPEDAPDNWDDTVETFRDRKKWEQSQEQRMRAAGFGEADILKWKKGGRQSEEDVRWTKAGEKREWDRGKGEEPSGLFSYGD